MAYMPRKAAGRGLAIWTDPILAQAANGEPTDPAEYDPPDYNGLVDLSSGLFSGQLAPPQVNRKLNLMRWLCHICIRVRRLYSATRMHNFCKRSRIQFLSPSQLQSRGFGGDVAGGNSHLTNTAYFNSDVFKGTLPYKYYLSNYLHEAGNLISYRLFGDEITKGDMFIGASEYPVDHDSGASYERCIFGQRMRVP